MTHNIQYTLHLILQSKYKIIVNIIIYSIIYLSITNAQIIHCMTEDNTLPTIAEDNSVPETSAIITETDIRQVLTNTIEKQREIIESKEEEITKLHYEIERNMIENGNLKWDKEKLTERVTELYDTINSLHHKFHDYVVRESLSKAKIKSLEEAIDNLRK